MNRSELITILASRASLSLADARRAVQVLFGTDPGDGIIADALEAGDKVTISGFGTFVARQRAARMIRDPQTGWKRNLPAMRRASFRAGVGLKDRLRLRDAAGDG